ncbi:ABC transporter substrate-binding protein [Crocosphaera sp.]|uniref:ABC transporter substrate-binding protein n=1 Tax=Crocosphaera sp. TaxID=2729996 RepID=UPI003F28F457|nr:ABC transporter substrate-binding protein [Crocosphaera sp.]
MRTQQTLKPFFKRLPPVIRFAIPIAICLGLVLGTIVPGLNASPVKVTLLMQALEAAQWEPFVQEFNEKHPDIELEIIEGPNATNQVEDLYTSSFLLGNSPYDLVFMDIVWVPKFAAAGWLRSLAERASDTELSAFLEGDINGGRYQGELYRMPVRSDGGMLYYRTDLLAKGGYEPPNTFRELLDISQTLQQDNLAEWGYLWQGKQYEGLPAMFVEVLAGYGAFWVDPDTLEVGLDSPEAIEAVKFLRTTLEQQVSPPGITTYAEEEARRLFQNGDAVFMRNWPYAFGLLSAEDSPVKGKFAIKPMVHAPEQSSGACLGGWGLGITTSSQHPDAAWEVAKFFSSEDVQRRFILATGYVPSRRALFNDPEILAKYPHYSELLAVVESAALRPPIAQYAQASDILQRYLSAAITAQMTPEQAMNKAANETRRLLGQ